LYKFIDWQDFRFKTDADLKMWISKYGWEDKGDSVFITNQEELVKTKKITEKISFDSK